MKTAPSALPRPLKFGGAPHVMRLLHRGDEERLRAFFHSHTPETIHERYGYPVADMSFARASQLVNVDQSKDCCLGIFEAAADGEILHAVGRYCLDADGRSAEVAFVVRESKRDLGMATALLHALTQTARERSLQSLWAQLSPDNGPMLAVFRKNDFLFLPLGPEEGVEARLVLASPRGRR